MLLTISQSNMRSQQTCLIVSDKKTFMFLPLLAFVITRLSSGGAMFGPRDINRTNLVEVH